jgi:hypothetical protein
MVFALLFSLLYYASISDTNPTPRPRISEQQVIMIAKTEVGKNSWFFSTSSDTTFNVLDFNSSYYVEEERFIRSGYDLPLVFIQAKGTLVDLSGEIRDTLRRCEEEPFSGWCEFIASLEPQASAGDLAYLVALEWASRTELFVVDATKSRVLNSTIYTKPILFLDDVQNELQDIGKPKISQEQAIALVEDDLRAKYPDEFVKIILMEKPGNGYIPIEEFMQSKMQVRLIYIHPTGSLVFIDGANIMPGYYCESGVYTYCGFAPPFNLNSKGRLVYGIDFVWNSGQPDAYAVDSITGEIVDSFSLRREASAN